MYMLKFIADYWDALVVMLAEMAPYLLLGFFFAGLLRAFVPKNIYRKHLAPRNMRSVVKAAALGIPLPLCSCGVIPASVGLRREGASHGACASFLIATPQTGVDSIAATYSLMGLPFAIDAPSRRSSRQCSAGGSSTALRERTRRNRQRLQRAVSTTIATVAMTNVTMMMMTAATENVTGNMPGEDLCGDSHHRCAMLS